MNQYQVQNNYVKPNDSKHQETGRYKTVQPLCKSAICTGKGYRFVIEFSDPDEGVCGGTFNSSVIGVTDRTYPKTFVTKLY